MISARKITLATSWLDGCSGCHMSFLDIDERLLELADQVEFVYSPLVDAKVLPERVDAGILEGAVSTEEDLHKAQLFRKHCGYLISLGDCADCGNVPAMRNFFPLDAVLDRAYKDNVQLNPQRPTVNVLKLLDPVRPLHAVVPVDLFVPGCPPSADAIWFVLSELVRNIKVDWANCNESVLWKNVNLCKLNVLRLRSDPGTKTTSFIAE